MTEYEKKNVDRIIHDIKEKERSGKIPIPKKAFYVYHELGDIYQYKVNFMYKNHSDFYEEYKFIKRAQQKTERQFVWI